MKYYAVVRNACAHAISSSLPYNDLGPGRWSTKVDSGRSSVLYPITDRGAQALLLSGVVPERQARPDGTAFLVFAIEAGPEIT